MVDLSFLSFLPIIGKRFKKIPNTYVEYIKPVNRPENSKELINDDKKYECKCCFVEYNGSEIITCDKSTEENLHTFCNQCVTGYIMCGINNGQVKNSCMCRHNDKICPGIISMQHIEKCVGKENYDKFEEMFEIQEIKKFHKILANYQVCPHCFKYGVVVNDVIMKCGKIGCNKKWCTKCKKPKHKGYPCGRVDDAKNIELIRTTVEETINRSLTHKCPKCSSMYVKETGSGCNHMTCVCGTRSCYLCGLNIGNSSHIVCPTYNDKSNLTNDSGNWLYNRKKIIKACKELLIANEKDVQLIMIKELEKHEIYINIKDLE